MIVFALAFIHGLSTTNDVVPAQTLLALLSFPYWYRRPQSAFCFAAFGLCITNILHLLASLAPHIPFRFLTPLSAGLLPGPAVLISLSLSRLPAPHFLPLTRLAGQSSFAYALGALSSSLLLSPSFPRYTTTHVRNRISTTRVQTALAVIVILSTVVSVAAFLFEPSSDTKANPNDETSLLISESPRKNARGRTPCDVLRPVLTLDRNGSWRWDYSLPMLSLVFGVLVISTGITRPRLLYEPHPYAWDAASFTAILSFARALYLTFVLPWFLPGSTAPIKPKTYASYTTPAPNAKRVIPVKKPIPFPARRQQRFDNKKKRRTINPSSAYVIAKSRAIPHPSREISIARHFLPPPRPPPKQREPERTARGLDSRTYASMLRFALLSLVPTVLCLLYLACAASVPVFRRRGGGGEGSVKRLRSGRKTEGSGSFSTLVCGADVFGSGAAIVVLALLVVLSTDDDARRESAMRRLGYVIAFGELAGTLFFRVGDPFRSGRVFALGVGVVGVGIVLLGAMLGGVGWPVGLCGDGGYLGDVGVREAGVEVGAQGAAVKPKRAKRGRSTVTKDLRSAVVG